MGYIQASVRGNIFLNFRAIQMFEFSLHNIFSPNKSFLHSTVVPTDIQIGDLADRNPGLTKRKDKGIKIDMEYSPSGHGKGSVIQSVIQTDHRYSSVK